MILICKICKQEETSIELFIGHFNTSHRVSLSSRFTCGVKDCQIQFNSEKYFSKHLLELHPEPELPTDNDPPQNLFKCPLCDYTAKLKVTLRVHRKRHHDHETSCLTTGSETLEPSLSMEQGNSSDEPPAKILCAEAPTDEEPSAVLDTSDQITALKEKYMHLYLTLRSKYHIPESTIQFMISSHHFLHQESNKILKEELLDKLKRFGLLTDKVEHIISQSLENDTSLKVQAPDGPLRTPHMRKKAYTSGTFRYVPPKSLKLGMNADNVKKKYHVVSVKESLEAMFEDDSIYEQFLESQSYGSKDGFIRDIYDGSLIQTHPEFNKGGKKIGLLFYEDDAEMNDPLGSAKGKYKHTLLEFAVSNLQPWSRMKEGMIRLSLIANEKDVDYFGLPKLLKPLVEELNILEEKGITIRGENVKVVLLILLGDNLGTHIFTGFLENFSLAKFFCRFCEEPREDWQKRWFGCTLELEDSDDEDDNDNISDFDTSESEGELSEEEGVENDFVKGYFNPIAADTNVIRLKKVSYIKAPLRTPQSYEKCLEELERKPSKEHIKGIAANCQLNEVNSFHCIGASPSCIAHDLFEGVIAHDISLAVKYFITQMPNSVDINCINRRIAKLKLRGSDRGDKPAKITQKMKKLRGSAAQNWNFLRFLPMIIGDRVNKFDKVWKMVLQLIELTRILTSPATPKASLPYIKEKIYSYIQMRVHCFPDVPLRPKHHFLEHYTEQIERFGCLMRVNTLPFESKHKFFKSTFRGRNNYVNTTKTLSEEHQLYVSSLSVNHLANNYPFSDETTAIDYMQMNPEIKDCVRSYFGIELLPTLVCADKVCFRGIDYCKGEIIVTDSSDNSRLKLCLIEHTFIRGKHCYVSGWCCVGNLVPNLQLYKVEQSTKCTVVNLERLNDYISYPCYKLHAQDIVVIKHMTFIPSHQI